MKKAMKSLCLIWAAAMTALVVSIMPCSAAETPEEPETTTESLEEVTPLHDGYYEG